jgi:hypothetical protein
MQASGWGWLEAAAAAHVASACVVEEWASLLWVVVVFSWRQAGRV